MEVVNIHRKDVFQKYKLKTIRLVDMETNFSVIIYIDSYGNPTDKNMGYWQFCDDENEIQWCYCDECFSDKVMIFIIDAADEPPTKRRKYYKY